MKIAKSTLRRMNSIQNFAHTEASFSKTPLNPENLAIIKKAYLSIGELNLCRANRDDIQITFKKNPEKNLIPIGQIRNDIDIELDENKTISQKSSILQQQIARAQATADVYERMSLFTAKLTGYCGEHAYLLFQYLVNNGMDVNRLRCIEISARKSNDDMPINHVFVAYNDRGFKENILPAEIKSMLLERPENIIFMNPWGHKKLVTLDKKTSIDALDYIFSEMMKEVAPFFQPNSLHIALDTPIQFT